MGILKKLIYIALFSLTGIQAKASHIVGGEIFYDCMGGTTYTITVKLYRDCNSTTPYDTDLPMTVFNGFGTQIDDFLIPMPTPVLLDVVFNNPCVSIPSGICVEEAVYTKTVTLPVSASGYTLSYQKCCRTSSAQNLNNPGDQGITLTIDIPPVADAICNSSPRFDNYPPLLLCANEPLIFDHSATDPDGDSLVYELCTPFQGGGTTLFPPNCGTCPSPIPALPPPYTSVVWAGGYTPLNPFGGGPIAVNSVTGLLTATPPTPGFFAVGVCIKEYRNGVLLSTNVRDFIFQVMNCNFLLEAQVTPQISMPGFTSFCQGLTVTFDNTSINGTDYVWDFGVPGITTDASTAFEPTYTFPAPGTYDVMLIVNPSGAPCTDTVVETFTVYDELIPVFPLPAPQCIIGNSFDFDGQGQFPSTGTTFSWDLGPDASPATAATEDVLNVVYSNYGFQPVTFTLNYETCQESVTDSVFVFAEPTIGFEISDELKCVPYLALFNDTSFASTPIFYMWNFGDGTELSNMPDPAHLYENVGVYDVMLTIWTTSGCIDTLTLTMADLIEVFPSPTSAFTVSPTEATVFYPNFFFTDQSQEGVSQTFYFTDGYSSTETAVWHSFVESGYHYPYQVVLNEYGCPDTSWQQIYIIPFTSVFVPNAFSPNGDTRNDIWQPVIHDTETYEIWVFDRWGQLIFNSTDENANWDGTRGGKPSPVGVYTYYIKYIDVLDGLPYEVRGHFSLVR
ncbi:MAG: gliding motility-associated C-terminal domain-containing protein [Bacteroidetes bacterium]|nr:gliding motility-associated C-terminal domain-containing protein [Bacteroidota bacterium]